MVCSEWLVCSMLKDWFCILFLCCSYLFFCFKIPNALCFTWFLAGPSRMFFILFFSFKRSASSFAIFFSTESVLSSIDAMQSVKFGGGAFGLLRPNMRFMLFIQ